MTRLLGDSYFLNEFDDAVFLQYIRKRIMYILINNPGTKKFEDQLFSEIRRRVKEDDISAPYRKGPYYYYEKTLEGKEYVQYCRRLIPDNKEAPSVHDTMPTGPDAPQEHVILDENIKAQDHQFYSIGAFEVKSLIFTISFVCILTSNFFVSYCNSESPLSG